MPTPKKGARFGSGPAHQKLMLANLAASLIISDVGAITTTEAKAKALRPYVEKLITKAKTGGVHKQRQVVATIHDVDAAHKLFVEIGPRWRSREISPSAQPVVSRATGLLYTLDKPAGFPDRWDLAALDWRTGRLHFRVLAGEGLGFNSSGGAVALAPDGDAFAGTFGGVVRFSDLR